MLVQHVGHTDANESYMLVQHLENVMSNMLDSFSLALTPVALLTLC